MFEDLTWVKVMIVIVFALVIQDVLLNQIVILGSHPDLMIILPVTAGIVGGAEVGAVVGFFAGGAIDLILVTPFGLSALVFVLIGYGAGAVVRSGLGSDFYNARIFGATVGTIGGTFVYAIVAMVIGQPGIISLHLFETLSVVGLGALVLSPAVFVVWRWALADIRGLGFGPRVPSGGSALR